MTRQVRMLVVLAVIAVVAVAILASMAGRYGRMKSVADAERAAPSPPAEAAPPEKPAPAPAAEPAPPPPPAQAETEEQREVTAFLKVRAAVKKVVDEKPESAKALVSQIEGKTVSRQFGVSVIPTPMYYPLLMRIRKARESEFKATGIDWERYRTIRTAYRDWKAGKPGSDPKLRAALDERRSDLAAADLGDYEPLDF